MMNLSDRHLEGLEGICKDRLGLAPFARRLAVTLSKDVPGSDGIVMALSGGWGSGKTSAAQMVVTLFQQNAELLDATRKGGSALAREALGFLRLESFDTVERVQDDLHIIHNAYETLEVGVFQPWLNSIGRNVRDSLYRELLECVFALAKRRPDDAGMRGKLSDAIDFLYRHQGQGLELINMATRLLRGTDLTKDDEQKKAQRIGDDLNKVFARLRKDGCRIVLFVDDVDRMLPEQVYELMSAVRAFMDLPGLMIILLYDEERVHNAFASFFQNARELGQSPHDAAAEFMHKIVQITFHLPAVDPEILTGLLAEHLRDWLRDRNDFPEGALRERGEANGADIGGTQRRHWSNVRKFILEECLETPRDVQRLFNIVTFNWGMRRPDLRIEDHIAIEALRLFQPVIFRKIDADLDELLASNSPPDGFDTPLYRTLFLNWCYPQDRLAEERSFAHPDYARQYLDQRGSSSLWVRYGLDRLLSEDVTADDVAKRLVYLFDLDRLPALRGDIARRVGRRMRDEGGDLVYENWRDGLALLAQRRPDKGKPLANQLAKDLAEYGRPPEEA